MINFLAKPLFYLKNDKGEEYPRRLSSRIRGEEIAELLGAKYTLDGKYDEDDICIYLKPRSLDYVRDQDYVDIIDDAHNLIPKLKLRPKIRVIAYNLPYANYLKTQLENEIIYIPHPHINFENKTRTKNKPIVGGLVGPSVPEVYATYEKIKGLLGEIEFKECFAHKTREDMLKFYDEIDFQVVWYDRLPTDFKIYYRYPGKIINAGSFGIPTIAEPIIPHSEVEGFYLPAKTYGDILRQALRLQDDQEYEIWSKKIFNKSQEFSLEKVLDMYRKLK